MSETKNAVVTNVSVPFNPFTALPLESIGALLSKFPKAWKESHAIQLSNAQTEHNCSDDEAIFYVWLQSEAEGILNRKLISATADQIIPLVASVGGTQSEMALGLIATIYNGVATELRSEIGKRVRDAVNKNMVSAIADAKLKMLYKHLGITEKTWMR